MQTVRAGHERLLAAKREEVGEYITQCMAAVHQAASGDFRVKDLVAKADAYYSQQRQKVQELQSLALLDGLTPPMLHYKDQIVARIEVMLTPEEPKPDPQPQPGPTPPKKVYKQFNRAVLFQAKTLESSEEIDAYVEKIRAQLKQLLQNCDGIQLK